MGSRACLFFPGHLRRAENFLPQLAPRSFSSSSEAGDGGAISFFGGDGSHEESPAYRRQLLCHGPPTVRPWGLTANSCSLIGTVAVPLKRCNSRSGNVGAYTYLEVDKPPGRGSPPAFSPFKILIMMWKELAEVSFRYLKPNDFIYVTGPLSSYEIVDGNEKREIMHKVIVKDLNYVQLTGQSKASQSLHIKGKDGISVCSSGDAIEEDYRNRLHLWQVFFANPHEWWDNRHQKPYPGCADFKHKHTHERLSLSPSDPPWIKKQLELYDLETRGQQQKNFGGSQSHISELL